MNLEIFRHIDEVIDLFESKHDIYKLIADEILEHFEQNIFTMSKYTLSMIYRIKTVESIREKLVRNNYISQSESVAAVLANFQDLLGFRIECKFIDDEKYVFHLLKDVFSETEDGVYFWEPSMPKIRLKLADEQPQKQKNGFDIYKIDGLYLLGRENVRFELQIKALVNTFWGDIEHKIIYKNNAYTMVDSFVADLMTSIKQSLNMIDGQLYVLYKRFKRAEGVDFEQNNAQAIERFISKMVYDMFSSRMMEQVGFNIDFKASCDAVIRYIMDVNNAVDMEDYGRVMLSVFYTLRGIQDDGSMRVDTQIEFEQDLYYEDEFSMNIYKTVLRLININFRWHLFFLMLFTLERGNNVDDLQSFILYYKNVILKNRSLALVDGFSCAGNVRIDILNAISRHLKERKKIEFFCNTGIRSIHRSLNAVLPQIRQELESGKCWEDIRKTYLDAIRKRIQV